jgi:DNA mismatch endonuclease (patch repair protein)
MDVMPPEQRYKAMAHNRGRTLPERALASALWHKGVRYLTAEGYKRKYGKRLLGQPDLVLVRKRLIVFVDGCFWHGCSECDTGITTSSEFWRTKIRTNQDRDKRITANLWAEGWTVVRIPEHAIRTRKTLQETAHTLAETLIQAKGDGRVPERRNRSQEATK